MMVALVFLASIRPSPIYHERVERLELNEFYTERGRLQFTQLIGWDFNPKKSRYEVAWWKMYKPKECRPSWQYSKNRLLAIFDKRLVIISYVSFEETKTYVDPEVENRKELAPTKRRGLQCLSSNNSLTPGR
jgi:hypothetical protein